MKKRTRLVCLLMALVLFVSLLPMHALADEEGGGSQNSEAPAKPTSGTVTVKVVVGSKTLYTFDVKVGGKKKTINPDTYIKYKDKYYEYSYATVSGKKTNKVTIGAFDADNAAGWQKKWGSTIKLIYKSHKHSYHPGYNRTYHWKICACGKTTNKILHVDPATDADKICTCGYKFSNNAELTTLWLTNMTLSPKFNKETTDYVGTIRTYLDVKSTTITAKPFDAMATVVIPENKEIHEGFNKFEIHVTAEDKTTTKVYTVIAVKPVKVEQSFIGFDGTAVSATLKAPAKKKIATATVSDAVMQKILEMAVEDKASAITLVPEFSKWSVNQVEIPLSADFLKAIAEKTEASLTVKTPYESTLTIPWEQVVSLSQNENGATICINKDNTYDILTVGEPITASQEITLTVPEA